MLPKKQESPFLEELLTQSIRNALSPTQTPINRGKREEGRTADLKTQTVTKYKNCCPICLQEYDNIKGSLPCLHEFCFSCI